MLLRVAPPKKKVRSIFISSTSEELEPYRTAARDAVLAAGCLPVMMEYFTPQGKQKPLEGCLRKVEECDLVIAIVGHRYGWVPENQAGGKAKSITWLECERAKEVIAFLVDETAAWPHDQRESYRVAEAMEKGSYT